MLLDHMNIPYTETQQGEIKGDGFVVTVRKNLYVNPNGDDKGSVINFLSHAKGISLREAASELKRTFLQESAEQPVNKIPNLDLEYHQVLVDLGITEELARDYEIGYVSKRGIMAGKIAFKCYDHEGNHIGYVGWKYKDGSWFFPKGFLRPLYNLNRVETGGNVILTNDLLDFLHIISQGKTQVVCLMGNSMTKGQARLIADNFHSVQVIHPDPDFIVQVLSRSLFVKLADINKICPQQ